jgi:hypothetical protein
MLDLLHIIFLAHQSFATSVFRPAPLNECWIVKKNELLLENPIQSISIYDGNLIEVKSTMPLVLVRKKDYEQPTAQELDDLRERLKRAKRTFSHPTNSNDPAVLYGFAFDYWHWLEKEVLSGSKFYPQTMMVGKRELFRPLPNRPSSASAKSDYVTNMIKGFESCREKHCYVAELRVPSVRNPALNGSTTSFALIKYGIGRPANLEIPKPVTESLHAIFEDKVITMRATWSAHLNEKYSPNPANKDAFSGCL